MIRAHVQPDHIYTKSKQIYIYTYRLRGNLIKEISWIYVLCHIGESKQKSLWEMRMKGKMIINNEILF